MQLFFVHISKFWNEQPVFCWPIITSGASSVDTPRTPSLENPIVVLISLNSGKLDIYVDFIPFFVFRFGRRSYENMRILRNHVCLLFYWVRICKTRWARQKFKTEHIVKKITQLKWPKYEKTKLPKWDEPNIKYGKIPLVVIFDCLV